MNNVANVGPGLQSKRDYYLRVERIGRPPAPWVWRIYTADDVMMHEARQGYPSAEDALKVGEVF